MGLGYYAFALFIAGLLCLVGILFKALFSNVKQQRKLLDEKESKLLQLYQTIESIMEEFSDQVKATTEEMREYEMRAAARATSVAVQPQVQLPIQPPVQPAAIIPDQADRRPRAERIGSDRIRAASEVLARAERIIKNDTLKNPAVTVKNANGVVFQRLLDETAVENPREEPETPVQQIRNEAILTLAGEGKTDAQIASELGITQNEVKLVIGITGRK